METNESEQLTSGEIDVYSPAFTPDSLGLIYLKSKLNPEKHDYLDDLFYYEFATHKEKKIYQGKGSVGNPTISPDGQWIGFAGHESGEITPVNRSIWLLPIDGGQARSLTSNWDRPVGNFIGVDANYDQGDTEFKWDEKSASLTFMTTVGGNCLLKKVTLDGKVSDVFSEENCVITSFDQCQGTLAFVKASPQSPGDLIVVESSQQTQLSDHNNELFSEIVLGTPEPFTYKGADNWDIEGWILLPPQVESDKKVPVVLQIHGGPHTAYGNAFHHEFQCLAAEGYAVIYTNPRGSQGYGEAFTAACLGDWGNKDREDIMNGLNFALKHFPQCDEHHLYVTGGSYGGFMNNMIISHSDRFKAAVTQRCISNMYSFFGTSDIGYFFGAKQLGGVDLWEDEETIMQFSPIRYAQNVTTPTCIIHSEEDLRCPIEQAEQWYVALTRLGVDTRFIRFKGENHDLSRTGKPKNRLTRLDEIIQWFEKYQ